MYWFLGGDARSHWAADALLRHGLCLHSHEVPELPTEELPEHFPCLILPVPSLRGNQIPGCKGLSLRDLTFRLDNKSRVYCFLPGEVPQELFSSGARIINLYNSEPYTTLNALATAEGALALAIEYSPLTLFGTSCLVIGAGRIGSVLAQRLHSIGARVTLCARKAEDRAMAQALCLDTDETGLYRKGLGHYDFVFNTVPSRVLSDTQLSLLQKDCLLIELASQPGGFSIERCKDLGLRALPAPGLPGRFSPKTAGILYAQCILEKEVF